MSRSVGGDDAFGLVCCCGRPDDGDVVIAGSVVDRRGGSPAVRIQGVGRGPVAGVVVDARRGEVDARAGGKDVSSGRRGG